MCEDKDAARHRQWGWKSEWQQADRVEEWHYQRMYFDFDCVVVSHCLCSSPQWLAEWEITAPRGHDNISLSHCHFVYVDLPTRSLRSPFVRVFRFFISCCCQSFSLSYCQLVNKLEDCYIWIIATGDSHSNCINRVISFYCKTLLQSGLIVLYNCFQRLQRTILVPVLFALIKTCLWKISLLIYYIFYYIEIRHTKAECIIINRGFKK